jgi:hypothetical protein
MMSMQRKKHVKPAFRGEECWENFVIWEGTGVAVLENGDEKRVKMQVTYGDFENDPASFMDCGCEDCRDVIAAYFANKAVRDGVPFEKAEKGFFCEVANENEKPH